MKWGIYTSYLISNYSSGVLLLSKTIESYFSWNKIIAMNT
jgi:hypothetical protein